MTDTFNPNPAPTTARRVVHPRILKANFGDGYSQRAADGVNTQVETWQLTWEILTTAEANAIIAFLESQGGYKAFYWTAPGQAQKKYISGDFDHERVQVDVENLMVTLVQVFDLG